MKTTLALSVCFSVTLLSLIVSTQSCKPKGASAAASGGKPTDTGTQTGR